MNQQQQDDPIDSGMPAPMPKFKKIAPWMQWPILFYSTIVVIFATLAVFVFRYVLSLGASAR